MGHKSDNLLTSWSNVIAIVMILKIILNNIIITINSFFIIPLNYLW